MVVKVKSKAPVKTKEVVCSNCAYLLEYTGEDVKFANTYSFGEYDPTYWIVCPRCKEKVTVKAW